MKDIFDSYYGYLRGWLRTAKARFFLWAVVYVIVWSAWLFVMFATTGLTSTLAILLGVLACMKAAEPLVGTYREWKTGKTYAEEVRESWVSLGRSMQVLEDTQARHRNYEARAATYLDN